MRFTQIADSLKYPATIKGKLSTIHAQIIDYTIAHYQPTHKFRKHVIDVMNTITLLCKIGDNIPEEWSVDNPLENLTLADDYTCKLSLGDLYIKLKEVSWDIDLPEVSSDDTKSEIVENSVSTDEIIKNSTQSSDISKIDKSAESKTKASSSVKPAQKIAVKKTQSSAVKRVKAKEHYPTTGQSKKEDLYIQGPVVPLFTTSNPRIRILLGNSAYYMYESLPIVPTKQCEISCTTNVDSLLDNEVLRIFPDHFIQTRNVAMYEQIQDLTMHDRLGIIPKVAGFTESQVVDNIIKYPHIYQLKKITDNGLRPFYSSIEIDGKLYNTAAIWKDLPDTKDIPMITEYMKEYVVRRYLLERDIKKIDHRYKLYGTLDPFLTLFTTPEEYANFGYNDSIQLARACIASRVSYKQSRNPIIRRASSNA